MFGQQRNSRCKLAMFLATPTTVSNSHLMPFPMLVVSMRLDPPYGLSLALGIGGHLKLPCCNRSKWDVVAFVTWVNPLAALGALYIVWI